MAGVTDSLAESKMHPAAEPTVAQKRTGPHTTCRLEGRAQKRAAIQIQLPGHHFGEAHWFDHQLQWQLW